MAAARAPTGSAAVVVQSRAPMLETRRSVTVLIGTTTSLRLVSGSTSASPASETRSNVMHIRPRSSTSSLHRPARHPGTGRAAERR
jgi:hypothetical protein